MLGKHHLLAGSGMLVSVAVPIGFIATSHFSDKLPEWARSSVEKGAEIALNGVLGDIHQCVVLCFTVVIGIVLSFVGMLLPDIDSRSSLLGRYVPFFGPHHGITHTNWCLIALTALAIVGQVFVPWLHPLMLLWLVAGMTTHVVLDRLSRAGGAPWYPFGHYKIVQFQNGDHCVVTSNPAWKGLYTVGSMRETVVCWIITLGLPLLSIGICVGIFMLGGMLHLW